MNLNKNLCQHCELEHIHHRFCETDGSDIKLLESNYKIRQLQPITEKYNFKLLEKTDLLVPTPYK